MLGYEVSIINRVSLSGPQAAEKILQSSSLFILSPYMKTLASSEVGVYMIGTGTKCPLSRDARTVLKEITIDLREPWAESCSRKDRSHTDVESRG
jgi:hypothetical protein